MLRRLGMAAALCGVACLVGTTSAQAAAPQCLDGTAAGTPENTPLLLPPAPCSDPDGDPVTVSIVSGPSHGTLSAPNADGRRTYTPAPGYTGQDLIRFKANDGTSDSNVATLTVDVSPSGSPKLPPPQMGKTANVAPEKGRVFVRLPAGTTGKRARSFGLSGAAAGFVPLTEARQVPIGSTLDTRLGTVRLVTAGSRRLPLQTGHFAGGQFRVSQSRKNPLTTLSMNSGELRACGTKVPSGGARKTPSTLAGRRSRSLFSRVHGHFRSRGRNSTATVSGTEWAMKDTCAGTLTSVKHGAVVVRDLSLKKDRVVRAGGRYFARARKR